MSLSASSWSIAESLDTSRLMISSRLPKSLAPNAVSRALAAKRKSAAVILDLTETNPTGAGFNYPQDLLEALSSPRALEYDPQPLGLWSARAAVASDFRRRGIVISADRVALTSSTSEAYALLFKLLCDAGDAVLVPRPSYPLFELLTAARVRHRDSLFARISRLLAHRRRFDRAGGDRSRARAPDRVAQQPDGLVSASRRFRRRVQAGCRPRLGDHRRRGVCGLRARSGARRDQRALPAPRC